MKLLERENRELRRAKGDSFNALAESVNGLYKTELIRAQGPWRTADQVELATAAWVAWWNEQRLHSACADVPPAEFEQAYHQRLQARRRMEMSVQFRVVGPEDEDLLAEIFTDIDETFFRPHPFSLDEARRIACEAGQDTYSLLVEDGRPVAYGVLRGWDEGYAVPSLGVAVRTSAQGRGLGRLMMAHLHAEAGRRGATVLRLRVHPDNVKARRLYESLGYAYAGEDRGELVMLVDLAHGAELPRQGGPVRSTLKGRLVDVHAPEWVAMLRAAPHDFYHLPAYVALSAVQEGGQPRAICVTDDGRAMLLPLVIRSIPGGGFDATSPYGYPGPIGIGTNDPAFLRVALVAGLQVLHQAGIVSAFIRLHPLLNPLPPMGIGTLVRHGGTVIVDLTLPTEELWAQTRLNHRRDIARAIGLGYVARMDKDWRHLESFKRLYQAKMARRSAAPFYFFEGGYFDGIRDALGESLHLCVVEKDGAIAAAGLFVETNGIVHHLSGTGDAFRMVQPTKLMMHFVRSWAKDRGNRVLNLGGGVGGDNDSLLQFKVGFSPLRREFATLRMVIDETEYRRLVAVRDPLLDPGARGGFFPLYRQA
jgi:Acetyltransferases